MSEQLYRKIYRMFDDGFYEWIYDPQRGKVYLVAAEEEMGADNGYWVSSLEEATKMVSQDLPDKWAWCWEERYIEVE